MGWRIWTTDLPGAGTFTIIDTKLYAPVIILSTQDNIKLLQQLESGFKQTINWNIYQSKVSLLTQNQYFVYMTGLSFQGANIIFILSFEDNVVRTRDTDFFFKGRKKRLQHDLRLKLFSSACKKWH